MKRTGCCPVGMDRQSQAEAARVFLDRFRVRLEEPAVAWIGQDRERS